MPVELVTENVNCEEQRISTPAEYIRTLESSLSELYDIVRQRNAYDSNFKLRVINFAEQHTNATAEREFGINEKMIRDWRKKKTQLETLERPLKKIRQNSSLVEALEKELIDWYDILKDRVTL